MAKIVDIIIVNWNSGKATLQALGPYCKYTSKILTCNIIIVDNGSKDDSINLLQNLNTTIIFNESNVGFAKACNQALEKCSGDYILLLNPDTISEPYVLEQMVLFLNENSRFAAVGPAQVNSENHIERSCGRFPNFKNSLYEILGLSKVFPQYFQPNFLMKDWDHSSSMQVDHVMGSYMLLRRDIITTIGFMDQDYFLYMEDIDLSRKIYKAGYKIYYDRKLIIHHQGASSGINNTSQRLFFFLRSRAIYWKKNFDTLSFLILLFLSLTFELLLRLINSLVIHNYKIRNIVKGYLFYFRSVPLILFNASNK